MDSENIATIANVAGGSKLTSSSEAIRLPDGKRSESDERRFQNALEDDEVRDALRVLRNSGATTQGRRRS
jgi:hypothetical protein